MAKQHAFRRQRAVLLGCALALFALACGEWAARAWLAEDFRDGEIVAPHWSVCAQIDPALGWSNLPNSRARVVAGPMDYRVEINSLGWRDRERALARKPGVTRILALGDSMTWGWGVDAEARFSDLLEERTFRSGLRFLSTWPTPVMVPPVPIPDTTMSTAPSVSFQISSAVVRR
jgi:hypothetical protein